MLWTEDNHPVPCLPFIADSYTGGRTGQAVSLTRADHVCFLIFQGATTSGTPRGTFTVNACSDAAGDGAVAIPFRYREMTTIDTWLQPTTPAGDAFLWATAAGIEFPAGAQSLFAIEVDSRELPSGLNYVELAVAEGASGVCPGGAVAILSGLREKPQVASAIV